MITGLAVQAILQKFLNGNKFPNAKGTLRLSRRAPFQVQSQVVPYHTVVTDIPENCTSIASTVTESDDKFNLKDGKNMSIEAKFEAAVKVIQSLPRDGPYQPSNSQKLAFYSLYKQATEGPCNVKRPNFWDIVGQAKWDAWNKLNNMSKEDAMSGYVENLKRIVETMSLNGDVQNFLESIGPFYEFVNIHDNDELSEARNRIEEISKSSASSTTYSCSGSSPHSEEDSPLKCLPSLEPLEASQTDPSAAGSEQVLMVEVESKQYEVEMEDSQLVESSKPDDKSTWSSKLCNGTILPSEDFDSLPDQLASNEANALSKSQHSTDTAISNYGSEQYYSGESDFDVNLRNLPKVRLEMAVPISSCESVRSHSNHVITETIERMNRDINHILARLTTLEVAYVCQRSEDQNTSTRKNKSISLRSSTVIFFVVWPVIVHFTLLLLRNWWSRRKR